MTTLTQAAARLRLGRAAEIVLVEEERLLEAARWIRSEFSIRADLSAAAAIAA